MLSIRHFLIGSSDSNSEFDGQLISTDFPSDLGGVGSTGAIIDKNPRLKVCKTLIGGDASLDLSQ